MFAKLHAALKIVPTLLRALSAICIFGFVLSACTLPRQARSGAEDQIGVSAAAEAAAVDQNASDSAVSDEPETAPGIAGGS